MRAQTATMNRTEARVSAEPSQVLPTEDCNTVRPLSIRGRSGPGDKESVGAVVAMCFIEIAMGVVLLG
jgi:hypothetical protein